MTNSARITVYGKSLKEARTRAFDELATYYHDEPWSIVHTDAEAITTVTGAVMHWEVAVLAQSSPPSPRHRLLPA